MYQAESDPYCYPDSAVLKNKAGLETAEALEAFETAMTFARSEEPLPRGRLSVNHYRAVHHHLFQDVYAWAGRFRTVRLAKSTSAFCYPENIPREMAELFVWLKNSCTEAVPHSSPKVPLIFCPNSMLFTRSAKATVARNLPSLPCLLIASATRLTSTDSTRKKLSKP